MSAHSTFHRANPSDLAINASRRSNDEREAMARLADGVFPAGSFLDQAARFAAHAHAKVLQRRKYTLEPYIAHPLEVAAIVQSVTDDEEMIAAALLHDVVEDTGTPLSVIESRFGTEVSRLVENLTAIRVMIDKPLPNAHFYRAGFPSLKHFGRDILHFCVLV